MEQKVCVFVSRKCVSSVELTLLILPRSEGGGAGRGGGKTVKRRPREVVKRYVRYLKASGLCGSVLGFSVGWLIVSCVLCVFRWSENITSRASQFKPYNPIMTTTTTTLMMMANLTYIIVTTAHPVRRSLVFTRCRAQNRYIYMVVWCCFLHKTDRQSEEQGGGGEFAVYQSGSKDHIL